jgi:3-oxoacyl-[acyl-carrier-protein] synthase-3
MSDNAVYITDLAAFLPNAPVSNEQMETVLGQVGERPSRARRTVLRSNGIESRHYGIDPATGEANFSNASLTAAAVRQLDGRRIALSDIDCLSCGTSIADQIMPNHASMVHGELGLGPIETVANAGVCASGMAALKYAYLSVRCGERRNAVATGSELASAVMQARNFNAEYEAAAAALEARPEIAFEKDFLRWMLSDGAGAALLQGQPNTDGLSLRIDWIEMFSYAGEMEACMYAGAVKNSDGSLTGWQQLTAEQRAEQSVMAVKQDVKLLNDNIIPYTVEKPLAQIIDQRQLKAADIDWFVPHYSSQFFRQRLADGLANIGFDIPFERWFTNLTSKGNTGSASIYIMLAELFASGQLQPGQKLLCYVPESGRFATAFMQLTVVSA